MTEPDAPAAPVRALVRVDRPAVGPLGPVDGVALVTLDRPEALNALSFGLLAELVAALETLDADADVRAIVLTGAGERAFAAGADIKEMADATPESLADGGGFGPWDELRSIRKPIVAAVRGFALGGGCELAMACDLIVAGDDAQFGQPEIRIGVMPGAGGTQRLTRAIGKARAMELILTGRSIEAREAERLGLVTRVVPAEATLESALALAAEIAAMPPLAVAAAKHAINEADEASLSDGLADERQAFFDLFATADQKEGMAAFVEKAAGPLDGPLMAEGGSGSLRYEVADAIATLTLNRPEARNALDATLKRELLAAIRTAGRDREVRVLVLTGSGAAFCAGQDLREASGPDSPPLSAVLRETYNPLILAMRRLDKPIVGAVNGVAAGAGLALALACDLRIAADTATFVLAFGRVGLVPDSGTTWFLPRLVGPARAAELALLGDPLTAADAERWGLVNRVVPADGLAEASRAIAVRLAAGAPRAMALTKRALNRSLEAGLEAQLEDEAALQGIAGRTADHREGVAAFLEKRPPRFTGE